MEKALRQLRENNYFLACRFLRHGNFVSLVTAPLVHGSDQQSCALIMTSYAISYVMNTCVTKRVVVLKTSRLRKIACFYYSLMFASIWLPQSGVSERAFLLYQVMGCICYVECAVHIPASLVLVLGKFCHVFMVFGTDLNLMNFPFDHGAFAMLIIVISVVLERTLRDRVAAQFKNADAESMISGFRQMLRGVCDGEVLLDDGFRIQEGASCLNRLLSSSECLDKTIFQDLLAQDSDELERFQKFISQPLNIDNSAAQLPAQCLRLSLQSSASQRAGVDAYHVALQHLFGCEGSYHLLAFKLDFESQAVPDATPAARVDSTMMPLLPSAARRPQVSSQASSRSGGTLLQTLPNLEELMMLVGDGSQQPVCQIHFKYRAKKGSSTSAAGRCDAAGEDTLPPLRTFIRPTDWETVRSSIARYAAGERCQIDLPRVYVKAFDRQSGYIQSRRVAVNPCLESARRGYMWLHFRDLRFEEKMPRAPSELAELVEVSSNSKSADEGLLALE